MTRDMTPAAPDTTAAAYEGLMQFLYQAPIGLVQTTLDGEITMINPMSAQLLMPLAPGGNLSNLFDVLEPLAPDLRALAAVPGEPGAVICEARALTCRRSARRDAPAPTQTLSLRMQRLDATTLMASLTDITLQVQLEQQRLAEQLHDAQRVDTLTTLPNRVVVLERIEHALQRAGADPAHEFAVVFVNIDHFDRINITLGHRVGDQVLRQIATRINATVRQRDAVARASPPEQITARLGGDEFVVVLEKLRHADDAELVARRLLDTLGKGCVVDGVRVAMSASLGVVTRAHAAHDAETVLQDAGLAMREAKRAGGARHCVFDPRVKATARELGSLEADLRLALIEGQLFVVYQPIVDLPSQRVIGFEALVRWRHPERGIVPPLTFIDIAEASGLIVQLGAFVLAEACEQFALWQAADPSLRLLSVNLSLAQLTEPGIGALVQQALHDSGLPAACLQLEVTESMAAQNPTVPARLRELKALGLTLALDDFGTGYSSLAMLHTLPVDVVKIDRSFVSQVESSAHHRALIEATLHIARSLDMRTVAEGIETAGQASLLAEMQCDKGQGYLFARPLPAADATRWLAAQTRPQLPPARRTAPA